METLSLIKYLSQCSLLSRRKLEIYIRTGRVSVNGNVTLIPGIKVDKEHDIIKIDKNRITITQFKTYVALHKPRGYISDLSDPRGRKLARDLIPFDAYMFPVGRLDYDSEGLMLFTNDGDIANILTHPRYQVEKEYHVKFKGRLSDKDLAQIRSGVFYGGVRYRVSDIRWLKASVSNNWYAIILTEGKNRMIRIIGDAVHHPVMRLIRVRINNIDIRGIKKPGEYRFLENREVLSLMKGRENAKGQFISD